MLKKKTIGSWWQQSYLGLYGLILLAIFGLAAAAFPDSYHHGTVRLDRFLILMAAAVVLLLLFALKRWLNRQSNRLISLLTGAIVLLSLGFQLWLAFQIIGDNIFDGMDTRFQVINLLKGSRQWLPYFHQLAENNVPLTLIEFWLLQGFKVLHINGFIGLNLFLFAIVDLTLALSWDWLRRHFSLQAGFLAILIATVYFPFYGYALFFYTDGLAVLFPVLTLWLLDRYFGTQRRSSRWVLVVLLGCELWLGFWIKGNNAILLIALILVLLIEHHFGWRQTVVSIAVIGIIFFSGQQLLAPQIKSAYGYQQPLSKKMPALTWTMMGWNKSTKGSSSHADTGMIQNQPTYTKKQALAKYEIKQRLKNMGSVGIGYHLVRKLSLMWAYGDMDALETINQAQHYPAVFRYLYGSKKPLLSTWNQILYLTILFSNLLLVGQLFIHRRKLAPTTSFIILTILGVGAFHLLFWEAEARYVYLLLPFLLILASGGLTSTEIQPAQQWLAHRSNWWRLGLSTVILIGAVLGFWQSHWLTKPQVQQQPRIMQTKDYGTIKLTSQKKLVQQFKLKHAANQITWLNPRSQRKSGLQVTVHQVTTKKTWTLHQQKDHQTWQRRLNLKPGTYQLVIHNPQTKVVKVAILRSWQYHAVPQLKPLTSKPQQRYLLLKVVHQWWAPLLSLTQLSILYIIVVGSLLLSIWRRPKIN